MNDDQLKFDRTRHVLYSKVCKKEIQKRIALHYPEDRQEAVWTQVQERYAAFLSDWPVDLGGGKNFHNGKGGTYDCIALMAYYTVCKDVASLDEIEEMEGALILPAFRFLKFVDCNKPFFKKLMYRSFQNAKAQCDKWGGLPDERGAPGHGKAHLLRIHPVPRRGICKVPWPSGGHARSLQPGLHRHGADPRPTHPHHHLRQRLPVRLHHLRRPGPLRPGSPGIQGRRRIPPEPLGGPFHAL